MLLIAQIRYEHIKKNIITLRAITYIYVMRNI